MLLMLTHLKHELTLSKIDKCVFLGKIKNEQEEKVKSIKKVQIYPLPPYLFSKTYETAMRDNSTL